MALLRSAGHGAPPCQAPSSLAPQRLPSTHPVNSSTYPGPVLPLSTLFSTILHYIPRGQGSIITRLSCSFYHCFYFHAKRLQEYTRTHSVYCLTLWRAYHPASQACAHLHFLSFPLPSFPTLFFLTLIPPTNSDI